jgi:prepilin-type N-terminal cleavage/methylation domain-containing protein
MPCRMKSRLGSSETGLTLIELLLVVVILGIITGAITTAFIFIVKTTDATNNRLSESHDAQMAAAYFVTDGQSADPDGVAIPGTGCGATVAGADSLVRFDWEDPETSVDKTAWYYMLESKDGSKVIDRKLFRAYCETVPTDDSGNALPCPAKLSLSGGLCVDTVTISHFLKAKPIVDPPSGRFIVMHVTGCVLDTRPASADYGQCRKLDTGGEEDAYSYDLKATRRANA